MGATVDQPRWSADCGVCGAAFDWNARDGRAPKDCGYFCPSCRDRGLLAPGVLHFRARPTVKD